MATKSNKIVGIMGFKVQIDVETGSTSLDIQVHDQKNLGWPAGRPCQTAKSSLASSLA